MKRFLPLLALVFFFSSCEDVIELDIDQGPVRLVVDGMITDEAGPYSVRLTNTNSFTDESSVPVVQDALVIIKSSMGEFDTLSYTENGIYQSNFIQGGYGINYQLYIQTTDGNEYETFPEEIRPMGDLDSLALLFNYQIGGGGGFLPEGLFPVINYVELPGIDYVRWKTYRNDTLQNTPGDLSIESDEGFADDTIVVEQRPISFIVFDEDDKVTIERVSLTKTAYEFWLSVANQTTGSGSPFDTPPAPIKGNVYNINDSKDLVLGYFGASSVKRISATFQQ